LTIAAIIPPVLKKWIKDSSRAKQLYTFVRNFGTSVIVATTFIQYGPLLIVPPDNRWKITVSSSLRLKKLDKIVWWVLLRAGKITLGL